MRNDPFMEGGARSQITVALEGFDGTPDVAARPDDAGRVLPARPGGLDRTSGAMAGAPAVSATGRSRALAGLGPALGWAAFSAASTAIATSSPRLGGLVWASLVPLLIASVRVSPVAAASLGGAFGLVLTIGAAPWFPAMVARYFEASLLTGWIAHFVCALLVVSIWIGGFTAWLGWAVRRGPVSPILVGAAWAVCEAARVRFSGGIPWALSSSGIDAGGLVAQTSLLAGPMGPALVVGTVNAMLAALVEPRFRGTSPRRAAAVGLVAVAAASAFGWWRLGPGPVAALSGGGSTRSVRVAAVQAGEAPSPRAPSAAQLAHADRLVALTRDAVASGATLVVWPESSVGFPLQLDSNERRALFAALAGIDADVLIGGPSFAARAEGEGVESHNSAFLVREGTIVARYEKQRPMPVAERPLLGLHADGAASPLTPGFRVAPLPSRAASLGVLLCSEASDPSLARRRRADGATILVAPSNDVWFGSRFAAANQARAARFRAIENAMPLVRAAAGGTSEIVDARGRVLARASTPDPAVVVADVTPVPPDPLAALSPFLSCLVLIGVLLDAQSRLRATR